MKVLLINNYHYQKGGADKVYFLTAQLLKEQGHEVFFFSTKGENNLEDENEGHFTEATNIRELGLLGKIKHSPSFYYNKKAQKKLEKYIEEIKPDISHIHLFMGGLTTSILKALKNKKVPIVHSVHDYRLICPAYMFLDGKNNICEKCKDQFYLRSGLNNCSDTKINSYALATEAYFRKYFVNPLNYIDHFIFVSNFIKEKHIEFNQGYGSKASFLFNFISGIEDIKPNHKKGTYILFIGRISKEKGIQALISANKHANVNIKIAGTGPLLNELKSKSNQNVEFVGFKKGNELSELIKNASFVVVPSEWYENNPLSIIEAYTFGKPVLASNIGGIPEIVKERETGFLIEPGNIKQLEEKLIQCKNISEEDYQKMSKSARKFALDNFSSDKHYSKLITIYKETIKNHN